ncbi:MAG: exopolysaccharide biosynthesis polyprenyl glycosylphosphotransferase [Candidatus Berkelbacteria bacterium Licking1014_7]|uniref:Exopolysaccharide biosynthesis polyprenyl glycosylphosphotransferase n=1 Tax=Candidatus Berkelbacteria bacterium Licking1014_7 TaxID=2017147 RepID=A0A554LKN2_9BACT|nr:MAG: exopolysaccharide biosynthesis polyprenyl glycosylphosphotransferase [Candidatus Berkelbacteria bacterium Licking1014_7]
MKRSKIIFSAVKVPLDYIFVSAAFLLAYFIRTYFEYDYVWGFNEYLRFTLGIAFLWVIIFVFLKLYIPQEKGRGFEELSRVVIGSFASTLLAISYIFLSRTDFFSRLVIFYALGFSILFVSIYRVILNFLQHYLYKFDVGIIRVAIIGNHGLAKTVINSLKNDKSWGYKIVKILDHNIFTKNLSVLGEGIDEVIVADTLASEKQISNLLEYCQEKGIGFKVIPNLFKVQSSKIDLTLLAGIPIIEYQRTPLFGWGAIYKRIFDIVAGLILILILSPVFIFCALGIKISSPNGPIFFRQKRVGLGEEFWFLKFRTMVPDAHKLHTEYIKKYGNMFKLKDDPRVFGFGKFLRKYSLDELPQFFNVLRGEMSLIGPRPPMSEEVKHYSAWHKRRLGIKPGITGLWQVSGRSDLDFDEWVRLDVYYIENWSLWLDLIILIKTIGVVLKGRGAY